MGLLNLRFGYFAQAGAETVVDEPGSAYNVKRCRKITEFQTWFSDNTDTLARFLAVDTLDHTHNFEIISENSRYHQSKLLEIASLEDCRFAIAVFDLHVDLIRADALQHEGGRAAVTQLIYRSDKFEIQIFNIGDKDKPLTKHILASMRKENMAGYLMNNANRSQRLLERWSKYV